jgi:acyl transferase domain-containing protein
MGQKLADQEPVFRLALEAFDTLFEERAHFSIRKEIAHALARLLISYGIVPDAIVGHSIGEVAAAHLAGALTLEEAVNIIHLRSAIQNRAAGCGAMLAVGLLAAEAEQLIQPLAGRVEIAAYNGPQAVTLTGDRKPLEELADTLQARGIFARFVKVDIPYHSRFMDALEPALTTSLSSIHGGVAHIPLYSTITAERRRGTHLTTSYWFENVRKPVRYTDTVALMLDEGYDFFIEIGPHPVSARARVELPTRPTGQQPCLFFPA